jgi:methylmalonyl-CoA mutase
MIPMFVRIFMEKLVTQVFRICCLDDAKKLYSGFQFTDPKTSVSMTINGPAPMLLGFFMNAAIDQQCEVYIRKRTLEKSVKRPIKKEYAIKN